MEWKRIRRPCCSSTIHYQSARPCLHPVAVTSVGTAARSTTFCRLLTSGPEAKHTSCLNSQSEPSVCDGPSFSSCQQTTTKFLKRASGANAVPEETQSASQQPPSWPNWEAAVRQAVFGCLWPNWEAGLKRTLVCVSLR